MLSRKIMFAAIRVCLVIPPAFAQAEAPDGYPVVPSESFMLLDLTRQADNIIAGKNIFSIADTRAAYSPHHEVILHAWLAHLAPEDDGDPGFEKALFYQVLNEDGAALTDARVIYTFDINSGQQGDDSQLEPLPSNGAKFIYSPKGGTFTATYDPDSEMFLLTWTSLLTDTGQPAYPDPTQPCEISDPSDPVCNSQVVGEAILGIAIRQNGSGEWVSRELDEAFVTAEEAGGRNAKVFSRVGLGGLDRFTKDRAGNINAMHIEYDPVFGFNVASIYDIDINDEIHTFDSDQVDASPYETRDYDVAYDATNDRYTVSAVRIERWISEGDPDTGERTARFFTGVVARTLDASRITSGTGSDSSRTTLVDVGNTGFIQVADRIEGGEFIPFDPPLSFQFESTDVAWLPGNDPHIPELHIYWVQRNLEDAPGTGTGVIALDTQKLVARRFTARPGGLERVTDHDFVFPDESPSTVTLESMWDPDAGQAVISYSNSYLHLAPARNEVVFEPSARYQISDGIGVSAGFLRTSKGIYAHRANDYDSKLTKVDWQWVDLAISSDVVGGDGESSIALDQEFALEVIVSNLDIGDLPSDHDSGPFTLALQNIEGMELVSHDGSLSGNMTDGFTFDAQEDGIAAGGSRAFEFVFRNTNKSGDDQTTDFDVSITAAEHHDYNAENDASRTSFTLSASADDSGDDDDTGDDDTGSGTGDDSDNHDSNGSGSGSGDNAGTGSGSGGSTDGGSGGGGALFWLIPAPGFLGRRR